MIEDFRTTLIITLSILVVVILVRRFKRYIHLHHMPVPQQVKLEEVEVMYHPPLLRVQVSMPQPEEVFPAMLSEAHAPLLAWPAVVMEKGVQVLELPLPAEAEGCYFFEIATSTQRTERRFMVRQA
ncbi:MAG: hypothetical protein K8H89_06865 [Flavobacteriales bacterium]|jgi:hypothetical protein|nr:hypothetical protein [Flavobacteriales bacterium]MCB0757386.1 hypothetical protein [Flavobacteriales bacterium]